MSETNSTAGDNRMWYGLFVGNGIDAESPSMEAISVFLPAFLHAGQPLDMAIFTEEADPESSGARDITLYFSPLAAQVMCKHFPDAAPCERPSKVDLVLLAGDQRCFELLFP